MKRSPYRKPKMCQNRFKSRIKKIIPALIRYFELPKYYERLLLYNGVADKPSAQNKQLNTTTNFNL